jgi:hypothetical protein
MMITDLHHLLDLPLDTPAPARRLAEQLGNIVQAATAGDAGVQWETALPCPRRPANQRCRGRIVVLRTEPGAPIHWLCNYCHDQGQISNWEDTPFDLRRHGLTVAQSAHEIAIAYETAATLRDLNLLDPTCQRVVFRIRANNDTAVLAVSNDDLDELIGATAAEANHEEDRRRQRKLDAALDVLSDAAREL